MRGESERAVTMVRALMYLIVLGVLSAIGWAYREGYYESLSYPRNTFLYGPNDHFHDLTNLYAPLNANDPYSWGFAVYPPFAYLLAEPFSWLSGGLDIVLLVVLVAGGLAAFVAWELDFVPGIDRAAAVVVLSFVTYPFLFAFDRANLEVLVTLLLALAVWALQTGRTDAAAVVFGAAAALKGYPLICAVLFISWRQWRPLLITLATALGLSVVGSVYYNFNLLHALRLLAGRLANYNDFNVIGDRGLGWGSSLFGPVKLVIGSDPDTIRAVLPFYIVGTAALAFGVLVALTHLPLRFWEQIALVVFALVLLPTVSADYKLLHLVVPMVLFLRYGTDDRLAWWYLAGFGLLMVPKAYVLLRPEVSLSVLLNPLIMVAMAAAIVATGITRRSDYRAASSAVYP